MRSLDNSDDRITRETLSYNNPCPSSPSSTIYIYIYIYIYPWSNYIVLCVSRCDHDKGVLKCLPHIKRDSQDSITIHVFVNFKKDI